MSISQQVLDASALTEVEANELLEFLGSHVISQLKERNEVTVSEVGTFKKTVDGISFTPGKMLLTHVNYRYVGLPIMDITGSVVSTEEPELEQGSEIEAPFEDNFELEEAKPVEISSQKTTSETEVPLEKTSSAKAVQAENPKAILKPTPKSVTQAQNSGGNQGVIIALILSAVAIVVIALTIWNPKAAEEPISKDSSTLNEIVLTKEDIKEGNWGLEGKLDTSIKEYYSIVLFSLRNRDNAYQMKETLEKRGLRSFIQELEINGQQAYRVAVGQFPDTGMAQDSAGLLPDDLRSSYFLRKIQNN